MVAGGSGKARGEQLGVSPAGGRDYVGAWRVGGYVVLVHGAGRKEGGRKGRDGGREGDRKGAEAKEEREIRLTLTYILMYMHSFYFPSSSFRRSSSSA